jgi:hypothetical protein
MRSILSMIKVTIGGVLLFLSLSCAAPSNTTSAKSDQSADRIGGQAGEAIHSEERTIGSRQLGGGRVGGQAGEESDPGKPDSEAK